MQTSELFRYLAAQATEPINKTENSKETLTYYGFSILLQAVNHTTKLLI